MSRPPRLLHATDGYALLYALLAGLVIMSLSSLIMVNQLLRTASASDTTRAVSQGAQQYSALIYGQRVAASWASRWVQGSASGGHMSLETLQRAIDATMCHREVTEQRLRLYVTARSCGAALPARFSLPDVAHQNLPTGAVTWRVPYILVADAASGDQPQSTTGVLRFTLGTVSAATYAVWAGQLPEGAGVSSTGPVYVLGPAALSGTGAYLELNLAGCAAPTPLCTPSGGLKLAGTQGTHMTFVPSPVQPCTTAVCVRGPVNARDFVSSPASATWGSMVALSGSTVRLSVAPDGQQRVTQCFYGFSCTALDFDGDVLISAPGDITLTADSQPSVSRRVVLRSGGAVTVKQPLTLAAPPVPRTPANSPATFWGSTRRATSPCKRQCRRCFTRG
ncbi:hypothetical protein [Deinococcus multiflagellatus]|uniref:Uncharacterized protein n=1 Tax=Deinococcus multiflagellatus TaxID=1656887 RepID=A0ABW1ZTF9_9DEIO